jgi:hypothetical protein
VHSIREVSLPYLDLDTRRYGELRAASVDIVAGEGSGSAVALRAEPPPLITTPDRPAVPPLGWPPGVLLLVGLGAPLGAAAARGRSLLRVFRRRPPPPATRSLASLHRDFRVALRRLVPTAELREGDQLADALRAAGIDPVVAAHATRVRDRLRHAIYGPRGPSDAAELTAETRAVLRALTGEPPERRPGDEP